MKNILSKLVEINDDLFQKGVNLNDLAYETWVSDFYIDLAKDFPSIAKELTVAFGSIINTIPHVIMAPNNIEINTPKTIPVREIIKGILLVPFSATNCPKRQFDHLRQFQDRAILYVDKLAQK